MSPLQAKFPSDLNCVFPNVESCAPQKSPEFASFHIHPASDSSWQDTCIQRGLNPVQVVCVAWGIILRCYTVSETVLFGHAVVRRDNTGSTGLELQGIIYLLLAEETHLNDIFAQVNLTSTIDPESYSSMFKSALTIYMATESHPPTPPSSLLPQGYHSDKLYVQQLPRLLDQISTLG